MLNIMRSAYFERLGGWVETTLLTKRDREELNEEVVERVLGQYLEAEAVERAIFDTLYEERRRLEDYPLAKRAGEEAAFYQRIYGEALHANSVKQRALLREIVAAFSGEVSGHFDPKVYALVTKVVPGALSILLNAVSPLKLASSLRQGITGLDDRIQLLGQHEALVKLAKRGTVVLVPTHSSNLDSILIGFALYRLGLPPFLYGAGLNLFSNKLIGFFMKNLGAYKVDRLKKAPIYKEVLKSYAGCTIEMGFHNLFFPGGTRSRSNRVESRLKLGLLGQALDAYYHNLLAKKAKPDVFVVPCTINYKLVLEAETLIEDHLKATGKSRYIIEDDEFNRPQVILNFVRGLFALDSNIEIVFGQPLDLFGNRVDDRGESLDHRGRVVERTHYLLKNGALHRDPQRNTEYTRELATAIASSYRRETVINSITIVARVVSDWLQEQNPELDLYRLLRTGGVQESMPLAELYQRVQELTQSLELQAEAGHLRLAEGLSSADPESLVGRALAHFDSYHKRPAVLRRGDRLFHQDRNLIHYYANRMAHLTETP